MPDCTERWDGITQCDSQGRCHRLQVLAGTSHNHTMETWPAIFPLNGGDLPSRRPRSHDSTAPLHDHPRERNACGVTWVDTVV